MLVTDWKPDKTSAVPLYQQIKDWIKRKIDRGEWTVGTRIPSQRALAEAFEVNRSTVVLAFEELIAEGLLEGNSGQGTRVKHNTWSLLSSSPPPDWSDFAARGIHPPNQPTIQDINKAEPMAHVIRLGTGEPSPELFPREAMAEALRRVAVGMTSLGYEEEKGSPELRRQLSLHLRGYGIEASPASILIVSGALQGLQLISLGLLRRGSAVLLEKPSYISSLNVFPPSRTRLHGLPTDIRHGLDVEAVGRQKRKHNASLLYTNPTFHNPTGALLPLEARQRLLRICEEERLPILEDDVYRDLWLDEPPPPPLKALDKQGTVLHLGSLSKSLSPGLRIGWVVGPEPVVDRLADIKMQTDYGASSLSQRTAAEWLASGLYAAHLERMREALRVRRDTALRTLEAEFAGIAEWERPSGGFYVWLKLPEAVSIKQLFAAALADHLLLNPGNLYDPADTRHLRISYAYAPLPDLVDGLRKLAKLVRSQLK